MAPDQQVVLDALAQAGLEVHSCRATVVRASRFRPITRYTVRAIDPATSEPVRRVVVTKGYYRGGGASTFAAMHHLWQDGFGSDRTLTIPEPIAYAKAARLLLQGEAGGRALYDGIDHPSRALGDVRRAARWLAKLHNSAPPRRRRLSAVRQQEKVRLHARVVGGIVPDAAAELAALAEWVVELEARQSPATFVPTHGDFQPKNIYVARDAVTVIDLDRFAIAHPARDLGHFLAQSATMSYSRTGSFEAIGPWNAAFVDEYSRTGPAAALAALDPFFVRTMLEILYYKLFVRPVRDPAFVPSWIEECRRRAGRTVAVA